MKKLNNMRNMKQVANYCKENGNHFFDVGTLKFFDSKIGRSMYNNSADTIIYFITSEQFGKKSKRLFTISSFEIEDDGAPITNTIGSFQQYKSSSSAKLTILKLI